MCSQAPAEAPRVRDLVEVYHRQAIGRGPAALTAAIERGVARGEVRLSPATRFPQVMVGPAVVAVVWRLLFDDRRLLDP